MYLGNYPNMANYNDNIPIGFWHWDIEDSEEIEEEEKAFTSIAGTQGTLSILLGYCII